MNRKRYLSPAVIACLLMLTSSGAWGQATASASLGGTLADDIHLSDREGHWHPHPMFFVSQADPTAWGAAMPGSPIFAFNDTWEHLTTFLVPVRQWSDGTPDL